MKNVAEKRSARTSTRPPTARISTPPAAPTIPPSSGVRASPSDAEVARHFEDEAYEPESVQSPGSALHQAIMDLGVACMAVRPDDDDGEGSLSMMLSGVRDRLLAVHHSLGLREATSTILPSSGARATEPAPLGLIELSGRMTDSAEEVLRYAAELYQALRNVELFTNAADRERVVPFLAMGNSAIAELVVEVGNLQEHAREVRTGVRS